MHLCPGSGEVARATFQGINRFRLSLGPIHGPTDADAGAANIVNRWDGLHAAEYRTENCNVRDAPSEQAHGIESRPKMANATAIQSGQACFVSHDATERGR